MNTERSAQPHLAITVALFALAFLVPSWPWLSGAVTVPFDAKSSVLPPIEFMAHAFATATSPFWSPNIFAGWPNIADPQSMLASPLHVLLAYISAAPSFRAIDSITFAYLFIGGLGIVLFFRDRGWHAAGGLVAALAFAFGGVPPHISRSLENGDFRLPGRRANGPCSNGGNSRRCGQHNRAARARHGPYGSSRCGPRYKNVTSRTLSWPSSCIKRRVRPKPKPPCGGHP